ncbi:MAG: hypothetical protein U0793_28505 [Gemmataceae bacterium]
MADRANNPTTPGPAWKAFEDLARSKMSHHFNIALAEREIPGFPKRFDMVSEDRAVVGDAKFLTLVHKKRRPSAKFMEIAGHVWLLERLDAKTRFLVFGNQRAVIELWLQRYGGLVQTVSFYFLAPDGTLDRLVHPLQGASA